MQSVDAVIVGAGPAGLATSRALTRLGVEHLVLERGDVGHAWRTQRWDNLRLLTPNWANGLPGAPYWGPSPHGYMAVGELLARLGAYARFNAIPLRCRTEVARVRYLDGRYEIDTSTGRLRARALILATGACARAKVPAIAAALPDTLFQTTTATYKRPEDLPQGGVLVVGASASGVQIARELQRSGRDVTLAVGGHTRLPRRYRGRDIEWWLHTTGVLDEGLDSIDDLERARRIPSPQLIGGPDPVDLNALQALGIRIAGRLADIRDGEALFSGALAHVCHAADLKMTRLLKAIDSWVVTERPDATLTPPDPPAPTAVPPAPLLRLSLTDGAIRSVVWACGYAPDFRFLGAEVF
ncbi:MAG: NAD(P)-binding domain-containing protein, partial [Pseudomonadota bacterium]